MCTSCLGDKNAMDYIQLKQDDIMGLLRKKPAEERTYYSPTYVYSTSHQTNVSR